MHNCSSPICQELFGTNVNLLSEEDVELFRLTSKDSWPCQHDIGDAQIQLISHVFNSNKLCTLWIGTKPNPGDSMVTKMVAHMSLDLVAKSVQLTLQSPEDINIIHTKDVFQLVITILSKVMVMPEDQVLDYLDIGLHHYVLRSPRPNPESLRILVNKCIGV